MKNPIFHLAFPVHDLELSREIYIKKIGCALGRESDQWIDFNFYGHQIVAHLSPDDCRLFKTNTVDNNEIPTRHFGIILPMEEWISLCQKLEQKEIRFYIKPKIRFKNQPGEQATFFIEDPSGNMLEFKSFQNMKNIF